MRLSSCCRYAAENTTKLIITINNRYCVFCCSTQQKIINFSADIQIIPRLVYRRIHYDIYVYFSRYTISVFSVFLKYITL